MFNLGLPQYFLFYVYFPFFSFFKFIFIQFNFFFLTLIPGSFFFFIFLPLNFSSYHNFDIIFLPPSFHCSFPSFQFLLPWIFITLLLYKFSLLKFSSSYLSFSSFSFPCIFFVLSLHFLFFSLPTGFTNYSRVFLKRTDPFV